MYQSEVIQLRQKITEEYEAMKRDLSGLDWGTAKHDFIDAHMKRVDEYQKQLAKYIGEQEATLAVCDLYCQVIG
jgi:HD-GYP domain-containing protein (c-di-GMP phosphodiesterase class II)